MQESLVHIKPSLITNGQSAVVVEPGECSLNHPPVPAQPLCALHPSSGNPRSDASLAQSLAAPLEVIPFVSMQLRGPLSSPSTQQPSLLDGFYSIHNIGQSVAVVHVSSSAHYRKRDSLPVDHKMALRARFSLIRWIRASCIAPFLARTVAVSTEARDQSILPASPSLSNSTLCRLSHISACSQSLSLRQQVIPLPQPISGGNIPHCMPVLNTKMIPVRAARLGILGRPPFGLGGSGGKSGSITSHSSSLTICFAIP